LFLVCHAASIHSAALELLRKVRLRIVPNVSGFDPRRLPLSDFETIQWNRSGFETKLELLLWDVFGFGNKKTLPGY
jgi:hypothetical protein